jgi:hypothetical protein
MHIAYTGSEMRRGNRRIEIKILCIMMNFVICSRVLPYGI